VRVVEDYAHHPTEIRATIAAARLGSGRVHVLYQPHRYSRTADCFQDYLGAFDAATAVAILPVYAAGEDPIAGAGGRDLAESVAQQRATQGIDSSLTQFVTQGLVAVGFICAHARPGDTILVLGAGDVGQLVRPLLEALDP
jgi:UDP-N-acetylmuramate--alanine ligase